MLRILKHLWLPHHLKYYINYFISLCMGAMKKFYSMILALLQLVLLCNKVFENTWKLRILCKYVFSLSGDVYQQTSRFTFVHKHLLGCNFVFLNDVAFSNVPRHVCSPITCVIYEQSLGYISEMQDTAFHTYLCFSHYFWNPIRMK